MAVTQFKKRLLKAQKPPKPKLRRPARPFRRKAVVLHHIVGTSGIWSVLAKRLKCAIYSIQKQMSQEGWEYVREAFEQERAQSLGKCINNVFDIADHSIDVSSRLKANKFLLEKLHPDYKPESKVIVEGGKNPIQHQHVVFQVPAAILNRPVVDQMTVLEALERKQIEVDGDTPDEDG